MGHFARSVLWTADERRQNQPFCSDTAASPPAIGDSACIQRPKVKVMLRRRQWRDDESWEKDGVIFHATVTHTTLMAKCTHTYQKINSTFTNIPKILGVDKLKKFKKKQKNSQMITNYHLNKDITYKSS